MLKSDFRVVVSKNAQWIDYGFVRKPTSRRCVCRLLVDVNGTVAQAVDNCLVWSSANSHRCYRAHSEFITEILIYVTKALGNNNFFMRVSKIEAK